MRAICVLVIGAMTSGLLLACTVETHPYNRGGGGPVPLAATGSSSGGVAHAQAMLVDIDTNRTMIAQPGDGVGVFTEYAAGGHWHIFWTCDTNQTNFDCGFDVNISATGPITNAAGESLDASDVLLVTQAPSGQLGINSQTSTTLKGITFDAAPGAAVVLDAQIDGQHDGRILFFVQDGLVNGGYQGALADPLTLEPTSP